MKEPKSSPISFNTQMVRALLEGMKTQTRRPIRPAPAMREMSGVGTFLAFKKRGSDSFWIWPNAKEQIAAECPYGQPGDMLWVREIWSYHPDTESGPVVSYRATTHLPQPGGWRTCTHMPRWASRITLKVTRVRVERLQDISGKDALAEGCRGGHGAIRDYGYSATPREHFQDVWQQAYGRDSWENNSWVWALDFEVMLQNVDELLRSASHV